MNFTDVISDIHKLIGLELNSVRPGAKITIIEVDEERGSLILKTASGQTRSRPIEELQKIWNEMMVKPAVHVEGVLHGSGTSRNQPETILANLPYIEWLKVNNKKHIAYVGKKTHPYGTIRQMGAIEAESIQSIIQSANAKGFNTVIVARDITDSIDRVKEFCNGTIAAVEEGVYQLQTQSDLIVFLAADRWGLDEGTYCVIEATAPINIEKRIELYGKYYSVISNAYLKALVK